MGQEDPPRHSPLPPKAPIGKMSGGLGVSAFLSAFQSRHQQKQVCLLPAGPPPQMCEPRGFTASDPRLQGGLRSLLPSASALTPPNPTFLPVGQISTHSPPGPAELVRKRADAKQRSGTSVRWGRVLASWREDHETGVSAGEEGTRTDTPLPLLAPGAPEGQMHSYRSHRWAFNTPVCV